MTLTIPVWALWTFGIGVALPLATVIFTLAYVGAMFLWSFRNGLW